MKKDAINGLKEFYNLFHKDEYVQISWQDKDSKWYAPKVSNADDYAETIKRIVETEKAYNKILTSVNGSTKDQIAHYKISDMDVSYALVADIDFAESDHDNANQQFANIDEFNKSYLPKYKELGVEPSCIVHTGGGVHMYWALDENIGYLGNDEYKDLCEKIYQVGIPKKYRYKTHNECKDKVRGLRTPYTHNRKYINAFEASGYWESSFCGFSGKIYSLKQITNVFDKEDIQLPKIKSKSKKLQEVDIEFDNRFDSMSLS